MKSNATAVAIFVGCLMVAGAIHITGGQSIQNLIWGENKTVSVSSDSPRRGEDVAFVYGNKDAEITIVEFSDYECPFCSRLHPTLERIVDESDGNINWEYRHLPLPNHRNAELAAKVAECVGKIKGNDAFWEFSDVVFSNQRSISSDFLTQSASAMGVPSDELQICLEDEAVSEQIAADLRAARAFGGSGTPFSIIVFPDGTTKPVSGALPYENWEALLNI